MKSREILICLAMKYAGNWDRIYEQIRARELIDEDEGKLLLNKVHSKALTMLDEEYPEGLKHIQKPPFVLFYHGDISLIKDCFKTVSVVGSRKYSSYGERVTNKLVGQLCKNFVIVSGMAMGIDCISHRATISNGGKTVAVLGCGINVCYIPDTYDVYEECKKNHLVISEYPDLTPPKPDNFPIRNRIIAGLSRCLLIPEGSRMSGTSITANLMVNNGGEVCCVPKNIDNDSLCNDLIAAGAVLVRDVNDIYEAINFKPQTPIFEK